MEIVQKSDCAESNKVRLVGAGQNVVHDNLASSHAGKQL
jgi:hypothetical protein